MKQKVTTLNVLEWVELCKQQNMSCREISKKYNVCNKTIRTHVQNFGYHFTRNIQHKQKYDILICLYDECNILSYCFDSVYEMSKKTGLKYNSLQCKMSRLRKGIRNKLRFNNQWYFIEIFDKEEIEYE